MAVVAEQPPEPLRAAERAIRDDEDAVGDPGAAGGPREVALARQRMPPADSGRRGKVALDVEERGAGNVSLDVQLATAVWSAELPAAVDELVAHCRRVELLGRRPHGREPEAKRPLAAVAVALRDPLRLGALTQDRLRAFAFLVGHAASSAGRVGTGIDCGASAGRCACGTPRCPCDSVP